MELLRGETGSPARAARGDRDPSRTGRRRPSVAGPGGDRADRGDRPRPVAAAPPGTAAGASPGAGPTGACRCGAVDDRVVALLVLLASRFHDASIDERSGLLVYDAWRARAAPALARSPRADGRCALLLVDIDRFKAVNDTFGHLVGDAVVRAVADAVRREAGDAQLVGRFGGDEFVVLLEGLRDRRAAVAVAERIGSAVRRLAVGVDTPGGRETVTGLTVSVGGAFGAGTGEAALAAFLWSADNALYDAKRAGGDSVRLSSLAPDGPPAAGPGRPSYRERVRAEDRAAG